MAHDLLPHFAILRAVIAHDLDGDVLGGLAFEFAYEHDTDNIRYAAQLCKSQNKLNTTKPDSENQGQNGPKYP